MKKIFTSFIVVSLLMLLFMPFSASALDVTIVDHPKSASANVGDTVSFSCTATGGDLHYRWDRSVDGGETWRQYPRYTSEMILTAEAKFDGYLYRCRVYDWSLGHNDNEYVTSEPAKLTIISQITAQPEAQNPIAGGKAKFTVAATGTGLTYQWQVSKNGGIAWTNSTASGNKTKTLSFAAPVSFNGYLYRCVITDANSRKLISNAAKLTIAPQITAQPKAVSANVGATAKFSVTATGAGLTYQWQVSKNGGSTWANSTIVGNKTKTLNFAAKESYNSYLFRCIVKDANGKKLISSAVKLTIAPKIISQPKAVSVTAGKTASFTVRATGARLTYQWQVSKNYGYNWSNLKTAGYNKTTFSVKPTAGYNGWLYRCVVTDANGKKLYSDPVVLTVK